MVSRGKEKSGKREQCILSRISVQIKFTCRSILQNNEVNNMDLSPIKSSLFCWRIGIPKYMHALVLLIYFTSFDDKTTKSTQSRASDEVTLFTTYQAQDLHSMCAVCIK